MRETKTVNNWVSVGDLTFVLGENEHMGLGSVRFTITQNMIEGEEGLKDLMGAFESKDDESDEKILEAFIGNKEIEIKGRFRDTLNDNKESDWRLERVLFGHIIHGVSASFRAVASEYPLGTFTRK